MNKIILLGISILIFGCAGMNPNPGERTADTYFEKGKYRESIEIVRAAAKRGEPWAQLRMGMYYDSGTGVKVNKTDAANWYKKAAKQYTEGKWAEGYIVGAMGELGYFGQKYDALIAQYRLADIYSSGTGVEQDLILSYLLINNVLNKSKEEPRIFFCCEWNGGRYFNRTQFEKIKDRLETSMSKKQLEDAKKLASQWNANNDL